MLDDYLSEFRSLHVELDSLLSASETAAPSVALVDAKLRELKDCLGALEMELRSMSPAQRSSYLPQISRCREELAAQQRKYLLLASRGSSHRAAIGKSKTDEVLEKLNHSSAQVEGTRRLAEETEEVGASILCNLYLQRESIQRANRHAEETNASLRESKSLISKMGKWWSGLIG